MKKYIMALDQGTTSSRTIILDRAGEIVSMAQKEFLQIYPHPGWVEHNPMDILETQIETMNTALLSAEIDEEEIEAIGITNQRETTVVWDKTTGKPVYNAIVWQCRRTAELCDELRQSGFSDYIKEKTGLVLDAYFSATKLFWILENVKGARELANQGKLLFGTIDTWLIWNLTNRRVHATDYSNASRTMMYDIHELKWDNRILTEMKIPEQMLPAVKNSSDDFGIAQFNGKQIPIRGVAGDQQAALFGQGCLEPGMAKNTYGTGCFILVNTGKIPVNSKKGLLTTIAWGLDGNITYALEGSIFIAGAVVQWLRDELKIIHNSGESEELATEVSDNGGVFFVPAFVGLGAPYWDMNCRGTITGLTRGTGREHITRAALESIAYQLNDVLDIIREDGQIGAAVLKVDGGAAANNFLMQFQSDISNLIVERPKTFEATAMGAAYLAGIGCGFWKGTDDIIANQKIDKRYVPSMKERDRKACLNGWKQAIEKCLYHK